MREFKKIYAQAAKRKGGATALDALLPQPKSARSLARLSDAACLEEMTKCIFRSGFVWQVIENKWPGFVDAFHAFDVTRCSMLADEELEALATNERIVRNGAKIATVPRNAQYILEVREEWGSFGKFLAKWPEDDIVGLWADMKRRGSRLGGQTGRFFLRFMGKDTPMFSPDVVRALIAEGIVDKEPTSAKALQATQAAFNTWREQSGLPLCAISRVLACSVPDAKTKEKA